MAEAGRSTDSDAGKRKKWDRTRKLGRFLARHRTPIAVLAAALLALVLATGGIWPFNEATPKLGNEPSLWRLLLSERLTLGFVRLALAAGAVFLLASIFVLAANNRWIVKLSATEVTTEQMDEVNRQLREYEEQVKSLTRERDDYRQLVEYRDMVEMETAPDG